MPLGIAIAIRYILVSGGNDKKQATRRVGDGKKRPWIDYGIGDNRRGWGNGEQI